MKFTRHPAFYIIGGGRTGASLSFYLAQKGVTVVSLVEINPRRRDFLTKITSWDFIDDQLLPDKIKTSQVVLLTPPDDHIEDLVHHLCDYPDLWRDKYVIHCSGTLSKSVLNPLTEYGAKIASFHPLYSFSNDPRENRDLEEIFFTLEADPSLQDTLGNILQFHGKRIIPVDSDQKKSIHLACVFYANFYVALAGISDELFPAVKLPERNVFQLLFPLLSSSVEQVIRHGVDSALTGPVKRRDLKTLTSQLEYLKIHRPDLLEIYIQLSRKLISISGHSQKDKAEIEHLLNSFEDYQKSGQNF